MIAKNEKLLGREESGTESPNPIATKAVPFSLRAPQQLHARPLSYIYVIGCTEPHIESDRFLSYHDFSYAGSLIK